MDVRFAKSRRGSLACRLLLAAVVVLPLGITAGCSMFAALGYVFYGNRVDARFEGLKGKKIVVVCRQRSGSSFSRDSTAYDEVGSRVTRLLRKNLGKKTRVVRYAKVTEYADSNPWEQFTEVGESLEADLVVGVDLHRFNSDKGSTVQSGTAEITITVYDMNDEEEIVYGPERRTLDYPPSGPRPIGDISQPQFRGMMLDYVARHIARHFYSHDAAVEFAEHRLQ